MFNWNQCHTDKNIIIKLFKIIKDYQILLIVIHSNIWQFNKSQNGQSAKKIIIQHKRDYNYNNFNDPVNVVVKR